MNSDHEILENLLEICSHLPGDVSFRRDQKISRYMIEQVCPMDLYMF